MFKNALFVLALFGAFQANAAGLAHLAAPSGQFYLGAGVGVSDDKQVSAADSPDPRVVYDLTAGYTFHKSPFGLELGYQRVGFDSSTYYTSDSVSIGPVFRSAPLGTSSVRLFAKPAATYTAAYTNFRNNSEVTHHAWRASYTLGAEMPAKLVFPEASNRYDLRLAYQLTPSHKNVGTDQTVGVQLIGKF